MFKDIRTIPYFEQSTLVFPMATWSEWFKNAKEKDMILPLYIDVESDLNRLYSSGLPVCAKIIIDGSKLKKELKKLSSFCHKHKQTWIRVKHKTTSERYYKIGLTGILENIAFINSLAIELSGFNIQIYEYEKNKIGGNIISTKNSTVIELAFGGQDGVGKGTAEIFHATLNDFGRPIWEISTPRSIKKAALKALHYTNSLTGYFEFVVSTQNNIFFLDYKKEFPP